LNIIILH